MLEEHDWVKFPELTTAKLSSEGFASPHKQITEDFYAVVVEVHDGDTITLRTEFRDFDFPLRLLDIDAPELKDVGGEAVRDWLKNEIEGKEVLVKINPDNRVGKYGRLLGAVVSAGLDMGATMLRLGMVKVFGSKNEELIKPLDKMFDVKQWF